MKWFIVLLCLPSLVCSQITDSPKQVQSPPEEIAERTRIYYSIEDALKERNKVYVLTLEKGGEQLKALSQFPKLEALIVKSVESPKDLVAIGQFRQLKELSITVANLTELSGTILQLPQLHHLHIFEKEPLSEQSGIQELDLSQLTKLERLVLLLPNLTKLSKDIHQLTQLKHLKFYAVSLEEAERKSLEKQLPECTILYP